MAINLDINTFNLPFTLSNFDLAENVYLAELGKAKNRAVYIMTADCQKAQNPGWGISQEDFDLDESGQLQLALELLTSAEFLKKKFGFIEKINQTGSYTSPTGESLSLSPDQIDYWLNSERNLRNEAYNIAYPYVCEHIRLGKHLVSQTIVKNYNWQTIPKLAIENSNYSYLDLWQASGWW